MELNSRSHAGVKARTHTGINKMAQEIFLQKQLLNTAALSGSLAKGILHRAPWLLSTDLFSQQHLL